MVSATLPRHEAVTLRSTLRALVERTLAFSGITKLTRRLMTGRALILAYHNVVPDDSDTVGDPSVHLRRRSFAEQLDILTEVADVVELPDIVVEGSHGSRPRVAITFDDAYMGAVTSGVEELTRRGMPATIFVAPSFIGTDSFWWDAIRAPEQAGVPPTFRDLALQSLAGKDRVIREHAHEYGLEEKIVPSYARPATEKELTYAHQATGITLASHSWSHPNLTRIPADELRREMIAPLDWLRERFDKVLPWLSYPYGFMSAPVQAAAQNAGYDAALCIAGGWLKTPGHGREHYALPRLNIPSGLSRRGFELRTAGLSLG